MSTNCMIIFDHPNRIYNSGDTLNGILKLQTKKLKSIKGISIKIIGCVQVYWRESKSYFKSDEQYINSINYVVGSANGSSIDFQPGDYEYNFTCELPIDSPTSTLQNKYRVIYEVIVAIERRIRCDNLFRKDFIVNNTLNLNMMNLDRRPRKYINEMKMKSSILYCRRDDGDLKVELNLPPDGYIPGQQIPFKLIVYNNSNNNLSGANIKLLKCHTLESTVPHKQIKTEDVIDTRFCANIPSFTNKEFNCVFHLPLLLPTFNTTYVRLEYVIRINIDCNLTNTFHLDCPITIGTIPQPILNPAIGSVGNIGLSGPVILEPPNKNDMNTIRSSRGWLPRIRNFLVEYQHDYIE